MVLESIVVCLDNSEWSRNGDFAPSRWDSQIDAANIICEAKTQQNPENTLGVMAYAGRRVDIKLTQTNDIGMLLNAISTIEINGDANFVSAIKVSQLSLKHRQNKNAKQRIIIFVGHPLKEDESQFEELGQMLNRNKVAVDIVNFAHPENVPKLQALINAANNNRNCHFLDVPLGVAMITDVLIASPIINMEDENVVGSANVPGAGVGAGAGAGAQASQFAEYGGVDPNLDPELAMALRISLEEERARQVLPSDQQQPVAAEQQQQQQQQQPVQQQPMAEDEEMDEEAILAQAMQLSMQAGQPTQQEQPAQQLQDVLDNEFVGQIAKDLGIDFNDSDINNLMSNVNKDEEQKKKEEEDKK